MGGWDGECAAKRRDGSFTHRQFQKRSTEVASLDLLFQTDMKPKGQIVAVTASRMPSSPERGCALFRPISLQVTPQGKRTWGCAQPCPGHPRGFPAFAPGIIET